jgi:hypothetical protein
MPHILKPSEEMVIVAAGVSTVLAIFNGGVPCYADVRHDHPGNVNTHKSVKMAAISSTAVISVVSLIAKTPTLFVVGGAMIVYETWKYHYANYGANGADENAAAASYY